jgi:hypothetical protein
MTPHTPLGARHGLVGGDNPLDGIGEGRKLARLDEIEELLVGDVGVRPVRHPGGEVLSGLKVQATARLWMRKNSERKGKVRDQEEADGKEKSRTSARRTVLKGAGQTPHLRRRARCVSETFAHARAHPSETTAHLRNVSVPAECGLAESECSHDGAVTSVTSAEMPTPT